MKLEAITSNIYRLRGSGKQPPSLLERYELLRVPRESRELKEGTEYVWEAGGILRLLFSGSKSICLSLRPEKDDVFWESYARGFAEDFRSQALNRKIKREEDCPQLRRKPGTEPHRRKPGGKFGAAVIVGPEERFYGLGEAGRDSLNLRGGEYQNWAVYQFDEIPIPFLMSSAGWGLLADAAGRHFVDAAKRDPGKLVILGDEDAPDLFFFTGGHPEDLLRCCTALTGRTMLLPKWAYGLTYIPCVVSDQNAVFADAREFRREHIPCDHISLEPQWMAVTYDYSLKKEWNLQRFHMPDFLAKRGNPYNPLEALRRHGFHTSLWTCSQYDFSDEEERRANGAAEGGMEPWYRHLSRFVDQGVDGFKLDPADTLDTDFPEMICANGLTEPEMHNLSQSLLPKQVNEGMARQLNARPMLHSCAGYLGMQHWSAATTGDNGGDRGAMIWLQNLALSGLSNATVDMNIHTKEGIHFAMLAPWAHLNAWMGCSQPWWETPELFQIFRAYAQLRYRLLPYLYSAAVEASEDSVPIVRPMPLAFPEETELLAYPEQYLLGPSILLTCYTEEVAFPSGAWTDLWTGKQYAGPSCQRYRPPENRGGGLFVRGGAILPCWKARDYVGQLPEDEIILEIYPHGRSSYIFREDDGESLDYQTQRACRTEIICEEGKDSVAIRIGERSGNYRGKPQQRTWLVHVHSEKPVRVACRPGDRAVCEPVRQ